jgi:DNA-binding HxlR family transcriptional regulator
VIALLGDGTKRFSQLKRMIEGISQRMLTLTLRGLERDGVERAHRVRHARSRTSRACTQRMTSN